MSLALIGLSHHTAPLEVREQFAAEVQAGRHSLSEVKATPGVREAVILSTCNRTELYLVLDLEVDQHKLAELLPQPPGIAQTELPSFTYVRRENAVVDHLFRVVSSSDS